MLGFSLIAAIQQSTAVIVTSRRHVLYLLEEEKLLEFVIPRVGFICC